MPVVGGGFPPAHNMPVVTVPITGGVAMPHASRAMPLMSTEPNKTLYYTSLGTPQYGRWTVEEDETLRRTVQSNGAHNWKRISMLAFGGKRSDVQCLHRWKKVRHATPSSLLWLHLLCFTNTAQGGKGLFISQHFALLFSPHVQYRKVIQPGIVKGPWTPTEDEILKLAVEQAGGVSLCRT